MEIDRDSVGELVKTAVLGPGFRRATFGGIPRGDTPSPWVRVVGRAVEPRGEPHLQFSYYDAKKDTARNYAPADAGPPLDEVLALGFSGVHVTTDDQEIDLRTTKRGKVFLGRRKA